MGQLGIIRNSFSLIVLLFLFACVNEQNTQLPTVTKKNNEKKVEVPTFNTDSAYFFVEQQVLFGPRSPNSLAPKKCGDYLVSKLEEI